ncbi:hypothetical protein HMPREF9098_1337 [Kingella denitrificans ATCC 33394]|uniref:Uncharacterized protein n=1 Tax=Kingella denitrificans ATCC 33394 TaxID=888741 RepID=F0EZK0_9NEIS|nr:hypothetical protein HMPREF9098_1337 [Kingella denitrificans ATCC 33394]
MQAAFSNAKPHRHQTAKHSPAVQKKVYNLPTPQAKRKDFKHDRLKNTFA